MNDIIPNPEHDDDSAGMDALFAAVPISTDEQGRHWGPDGAVDVDVDGEVTYVPAEPLATWVAPTWATSTRAEDGGLWHERPAAHRCTALDSRGSAQDITPSLRQHDAIDTGPDGHVTVRRGEPMIAVDDLWLTPGQALDLGRALVDLAGQVTA